MFVVSQQVDCNFNRKPADESQESSPYPRSEGTGTGSVPRTGTECCFGEMKLEVVRRKKSSRKGWTDLKMRKSLGNRGLSRGEVSRWWGNVWKGRTQWPGRILNSRRNGRHCRRERGSARSGKERHREKEGTAPDLDGSKEPLISVTSVACTLVACSRASLAGGRGKRRGRGEASYVTND